MDWTPESQCSPQIGVPADLATLLYQKLVDFSQTDIDKPLGSLDCEELPQLEETSNCAGSEAFSNFLDSCQSSDTELGEQSPEECLSLYANFEETAADSGHDGMSLATSPLTHSDREESPSQDEVDSDAYAAILIENLQSKNLYITADTLLWMEMLRRALLRVPRKRVRGLCELLLSTSDSYTGDAWPIGIPEDRELRECEWLASIAWFYLDPEQPILKVGEIHKQLPYYTVTERYEIWRRVTRLRGLIYRIVP